jgi:rhodanese-related sulfurtransferase
VIVLAAAAASAIAERFREDPLPMSLPPAFYHTESAARPILLKKAKRMFGEGGTVFLDARPPQDYEAGQIDGALNLPFDRWRELLPEILPWIAGQKIVVYSDAPSIVAADDLAGALLSRGTSPDSLFLYLGGIEEWIAAGLPVRRGGGPLSGWPAEGEDGGSR